MTPVDLQDLRTRRGPRPDACLECGEPYPSEKTLVCRGCFAVHIEDPAVLALCDEVEALRQTVRGCETCGGDGMMMVPAGYNEDEVGDLRPEVCAECHGTCVSSWGQAIDEAAALRAEVEALRVQVAAAPDVLRGWPKRVEKGPWLYVTEDGALIRGSFDTEDGHVVFRNEDSFPLPSGMFADGEFFVRLT